MKQHIKKVCILIYMFLGILNHQNTLAKSYLSNLSGTSLFVPCEDGYHEILNGYGISVRGNTFTLYLKDQAADHYLKFELLIANASEVDHPMLHSEFVYIESRSEGLRYTIHYTSISKQGIRVSEVQPLKPKAIFKDLP